MQLHQLIFFENRTIFDNFTKLFQDFQFPNKIILKNVFIRKKST